MVGLLELVQLNDYRLRIDFDISAFWGFLFFLQGSPLFNFFLFFSYQAFFSGIIGLFFSLGSFLSIGEIFY